MNKKLLIISPYFPPSNAADMQRVRMSLPYFKQFGWDAEVVTIDPVYSEMPRDELLLQSVPPDTKIHYIKALNKSWTSKLGLGSIALRSLRFYRKRVNELLKQNHFDLVYFCTTQFPVCTLGAYWKKHFRVPYVIDMQDPWHSEYYRDKPKSQQPPKYWFSYRLNKYMEPKAMKHVDGLISVSESYITDLKKRYLETKNIPSETITFGAFEPDLKIAEEHKNLFPSLLAPECKNIVYVGRGGADMHRAVNLLFKVFKTGLDKEPGIFDEIKLYFIGTSYAPKGKGEQTIVPLAKELGIQDHVIEITDRISYYHTLTTLQQADALFIPGSDDPKYTASKIYPYVLAKKPILALFHPQSSAINILHEYGAPDVYSYDAGKDDEIYHFLRRTAMGESEPAHYMQKTVEKYSAANMTRRQCEVFNQVISGKN